MLWLLILRPPPSTDLWCVYLISSFLFLSFSVLRFIKGTFPTSYIPTIEDTYRQVTLLFLRHILTLSMTDIIDWSHGRVGRELIWLGIKRHDIFPTLQKREIFRAILFVNNKFSLFLGDNMQQKHLHATSELTSRLVRLDNWLAALSFLGHGYDGQSPVSRDATTINHQRACFYPRLFGVFETKLRRDSTHLASNTRDKSWKPEFDSCDGWWVNETPLSALKLY